ncbi:peptide-methionine (S)-S-oxide reductase [Ulvibacter litoralis]|uniref:peptide-methionine (S)-S-oxide reductase n=1 Tax=Ulvibacter litoralis TaxID=227084 RepID=A0A1G7EWK4_9FLAO|nr:peptide-methionine (S)-S-oxide reductase [Ulvibacter litoralis]GHC53608.1 peptide methionine sulfoxide reductase MsrA [Ulvibacter litoralis]SDE68078.1 peptide-methionine (S)-S-oxide reductase [Ulvibacter litoralis]
MIGINTQQIALGGGCHWCTEAVFQSLKGVEKVEQGYVAATGEYSSFSEAVIVSFSAETISLQTLIEIHLYTHKSTSNHSMRTKYRSAIYTFSEAQQKEAKSSIEKLQKDFTQNLVTQVLSFSEFKASREAIQNYYQKNPNKPFCETFINPKLKLLLKQFSDHVTEDTFNHLSNT